MPEPLRDRDRFWSPVPDWNGTEIRRQGWRARRLDGLGQVLVTGDLVAARSAIAPGADEAGLWAIARAPAVLVRMARDRGLIVTPEPLGVEAGWRGSGFAATPADDLNAVLELEGEGVPDLFAEAVSADLRTGSPSAAVMFAGMPVLIYRTAMSTARLHVEAPLAAWLWNWLENSSS